MSEEKRNFLEEIIEDVDSAYNISYRNDGGAEVNGDFMIYQAGVGSVVVNPIRQFQNMIEIPSDNILNIKKLYKVR